MTAVRVLVPDTYRCVSMFEIEVRVALSVASSRRAKKKKNTQQACKHSSSFSPDAGGVSNGVRSCVRQKRGWQQCQACRHHRETCSRQQQTPNTRHRKVELGGRGVGLLVSYEEQRITQKMLGDCRFDLLTDRYIRLKLVCELRDILTDRKYD